MLNENQAYMAISAVIATKKKKEAKTEHGNSHTCRTHLVISIWKQNY